MTIDFTRRVVFAAECKPCEMCGEPVCPECDLHYDECPCPGPDSDPLEDEEIEP